MCSVTRNIRVKIISDAGYILTWVYMPTINGKAHYFVLPVSQYETTPTFFDSQESFKTMQACLKIIRPILEAQNKDTQEIIYNTASKSWGKK
jgi:hypothetical protein